MSYTREGILAQVCVAFGQGTGEVRVSQEACVALYDRYSQMVTEDAIANWDTYAVQALERIRALGRMVATRTKLDGLTAISAGQVTTAAAQVEINSDTALCGPPPPP